MVRSLASNGYKPLLRSILASACEVAKLPRDAVNGGTYGVVATTDCVAEEAKKFFQEERPDTSAMFESIEGYKNIDKGIRSLVDRYSRIGVNQLLAEVTESVGINIVPVLSAWMNAVTRHQNVPVSLTIAACAPPTVGPIAV